MQYGSYLAAALAYLMHRQRDAVGLLAFDDRIRKLLAPSARAGQLSALLAQQQRQPARLVLRTAYQQEGPSQWIASKTGMPAVLLPYTVGGTPEAKDLFGLFDDTIQRLLKGAR